MHIQSVSWADVLAWTVELAQKQEVDTIIGIARSGVPLAVATAYHLPNATLAFATRVSPRGNRAEEYDFSVNPDDRRQEIESKFSIDPAISLGAKVLVVDDVATTGDTLAVIEDKLLQRSKSLEVHFATFAVDLTRIGARNPSVLARLQYAVAIDNSRVWITFPWIPAAKDKE